MEKEKMEKALKDKDFVAKILAMQTAEEVRSAFKEKGVDISLEEVEILGEIINKIAQKGEMLTEKELEEISGGGDLTDAIGWGAFFTVGSFIDGVKDPNFSEGIHALVTSDPSEYELNDSFAAKVVLKSMGLAGIAGSVVGKVKNGVKWAKQKITGTPKSSK